LPDTAGGAADGSDGITLSDDDDARLEDDIAAGCGDSAGPIEDVRGGSGADEEDGDVGCDGGGGGGGDGGGDDAGDCDDDDDDPDVDDDDEPAEDDDDDDDDEGEGDVDDDGGRATRSGVRGSSSSESDDGATLSGVNSLDESDTLEKGLSSSSSPSRYIGEPICSATFLRGRLLRFFEATTPRPPLPAPAPKWLSASLWSAAKSCCRPFDEEEACSDEPECSMKLKMGSNGSRDVGSAGVTRRFVISVTWSSISASS
jgi:hypothetical protein